MPGHIDPKALDVLASLQRPGRPNLLNRIVELFNTESPKIIKSMQKGLDSGDLGLVHDAAHTLRSSSAYVGAKQLSECCCDLEIAAREKNMSACIALGKRVTDLFEASLKELSLHVSNVA